MNRLVFGILVCLILVVSIVACIVYYRKYYTVPTKPEEHTIAALTQTDIAKIPANIPDMRTFSLEFEFRPSLNGISRKLRVWSLSAEVPSEASADKSILEYRGVITPAGKFKIVWVPKTAEESFLPILYTLETSNAVNFNDLNTFKFTVEHLIDEMGGRILSWEIELNNVKTVVESFFDTTAVIKKSGPYLMFRFFEGSVGKVNINGVPKTIKVYKNRFA